MRRSRSGSRWTAVLLGAAVAWGCAGKGGTPHKPRLDVTDKVRLAQAYVNAGRVSEALATLDEAVGEEPQNASLHNFYGQVCLIAGRYEQGARALRRALELDPYLTDAHNNLGAVYDKMGRKDDAEREYLRALDDPAYPTPEKVQLNLGLLYASQGRTREAVERLRRAVEINPRYYQAHFELASVLDREGQLEQAAGEYEVAAPGYRGNADYHFRLGFTYFRLGARADAREHLGRVLELSPGSANAVRADELLKMLE